MRKGIHWQNITPADGREFIADDVVFHYNRMYALGGGFYNPSPYHEVIGFKDLISVVTSDNYTVVFKWKTSNREFIMETLHGVTQGECLENPETVKKWGDVDDWHHGPCVTRLIAC